MTLTARRDGTMAADSLDPGMAPLPGEPPPGPPGPPPWRPLALVLLLAALTVAGVATVLRGRPGASVRPSKPVAALTRDPAAFETTTLKRAPSSAAAAAGVV